MEDTIIDPSRFRDATRSARSELNYRAGMEQYIQESGGTFYEKLENFPKYTSRQTMARFLALYEIFKKVINVQGEIIECGVNWGGGLMGFALMSTVLEPVNLQRRIIGFDTFTGFTKISAQDSKSVGSAQLVREGGFKAESYEDLQSCIELYDANRSINHIGKVSLVKGDATQTIPEYLEQHPYTVVSLLHLDFDVYEPTKVAINNFVPRMPRGAVIVFDELNNQVWPGETVAVLETLSLHKLRIERFPFEPHISYAVLD